MVVLRELCLGRKTLPQQYATFFSLRLVNDEEYTLYNFNISCIWFFGLLERFLETGLD